MIKVGKRKCKILRLKGKKKKPPNPPPPWLELPADITANILHRLGAVEILETAQKVCTNWRRVCKDPSMWRVIDMRNLGDLLGMPYNLGIMCRHAVDRSHGQLIDINIGYFGTDELLSYIGERCNHLKCLRIAPCYGISSKGLTEAVKKFPELEELHLFFMRSFAHEAIENFGTSCPKLKAFTYINHGCNYSILTDAESNANALAVAKSMPNLLHLRLFGDTMKNEGLEAILNNCPNLESLDIRQCFSIDLRGDLGKRCSKQIKYLRRPGDCIDDYERDCSFDYSRHLYCLYGHDLYDDCYSSEHSHGSFNFSDYSDYGIDYDNYDSDPFYADDFPMASP